MLHQLPAEIALHAISYLPLHSLYSAIQVSRDWNALIAINEYTVYRNVALLHRFTDENQLRAGFKVPIDWRTYCRRQLEIERGWRGKAPSSVRELTATGTAVHRIKVDHGLGLIIATRQTGGLFVCDFRNNRVLWSLPPSHVVNYAHCEYDRGYIVFNRHDDCKEVWRHTVDAEGVQVPKTSPPDQKMLEASTQAAATHGSADYRWGHFKAWALLRIPETSRAFRFSYPTLLASAKNNAYLWDVPRSQLTLVIRDIQRSHHGVLLGNINYVEVNDLYVFICGAGGLRIFAREGGTLLYQISTMELCSATWDVWDVTPQTQSCGLPSSVLHPQMLIHNFHSPAPLHDEFMACHVSGSGNDLAVLTSNGRLLLIADFQCLISGSNAVHHRDNAIILNFHPFPNGGEASYYLAVDNESRKIAIATRKGIYMISTDFGFSRLIAGRPPEPGVTVCRLSKFDNERLLPLISCLQITNDAIYFTDKPTPTSVGNTTQHAAQAHHAGAHDAFEPDFFPHVVDDIDDGFDDGWEDEDSEEETMGFGFGEEDDFMHAIIDDWFLPTNVNTVHSVSF